MSNKDKKLNAPFFLDLPFEEAVARYVQTRAGEVEPVSNKARKKARPVAENADPSALNGGLATPDESAAELGLDQQDESLVEPQERSKFLPPRVKARLSNLRRRRAAAAAKSRS